MLRRALTIEPGLGIEGLTSSPSRNGTSSSLRRTLPTVLFPQPAGPVTTQICCRGTGFVWFSWSMDAVVEVPLTRSDMMRALTESALGTCGGCDRSPAESMLKMFGIGTGGTGGRGFPRLYPVGGSWKV